MLSETQLQISLAVVRDIDGGNRAVVAAVGEIDVASVELLRTAALAAAAPHPYGRPVRLVLDWRAVSFLDCSAVRLLRELHAAGIEEGWTLRWMPPTASGPARLLQLAADHGWLPLPLAHQLPAQSATLLVDAGARCVDAGYR